MRGPSKTSRAVIFAALAAVTTLGVAGCGSAQHGKQAASASASSSQAAATVSSSSAPSLRAEGHADPAAIPTALSAIPRPSAPPTSTAAPAAPAAPGLPLPFPTGSAAQLITVVAPSAGSTTATLQAWDRGAGGWVTHGPSVLAHVGADGLGQASETTSRTPIGSFSLTQAFGADANPGTGLPYFQTTSADWWISQSGPLYNTHQHCSSGCAFTQGDPNEHLVTELPYYNYAVVIDYNTANAGPVVPGAGSAFFLHVTDGTPTAGCVSIPQANLVSIMQWLTPSASPRILIGVG